MGVKTASPSAEIKTVELLLNCTLYSSPPCACSKVFKKSVSLPNDLEEAAKRIHYIKSQLFSASLFNILESMHKILLCHVEVHVVLWKSTVRWSYMLN